MFIFLIAILEELVIQLDWDSRADGSAGRWHHKGEPKSSRRQPSRLKLSGFGLDHSLCFQINPGYVLVHTG